MKNDLPYDSSINTPHMHVTRESHPSMGTHHDAAEHAEWLPVRDDAPCSISIRVHVKHCAGRRKQLTFSGAALLCTHCAKVQILSILDSLLARTIEKVHACTRTAACCCILIWAPTSTGAAGAAVSKECIIRPVLGGRELRRQSLTRLLLS